MDIEYYLLYNVFVKSDKYKYKILKNIFILMFIVNNQVMLIFI